MKKLILLFTLLSGVALAQIPFPAYLPINSSRSATIGTIRTNSLVVTASTISVGAKTLTSGNTGTVAVLSDVYNSINYQFVSSNPADGITYSIGVVPFALANSFDLAQVPIPFNCEIVQWQFNGFINGATSTSESATLQIIVGSTVTTLNSAINCTTAIQTYSAGGLSINVPANSNTGIRMIFPTYATNPTSFGAGILVWFRRKS